MHEKSFAGNLPLLAGSKLDQFALAASDGQVKTRSRRDSSKSPGGDTSPSKLQSSTGMLMYKGAMLDVNSVMMRLERSEKSRTALETKLKDQQEEMGGLCTVVLLSLLGSVEVICGWKQGSVA